MKWAVWYVSRGWEFVYICRSVWGKAFFSVACWPIYQHGEAPNRTLHFQVNVSVVDLVGKVILLGGPQGGKGKRDVHVCVSIKGGQKVEVVCIQAHVSGVGCAEYAV